MASLKTTSGCWPAATSAVSFSRKGGVPPGTNSWLTVIVGWTCWNSWAKRSKSWRWFSDARVRKTMVAGPAWEVPAPPAWEVPVAAPLPGAQAASAAAAGASETVAPSRRRRDICGQITGSPSLQYGRYRFRAIEGNGSWSTSPWRAPAC
jgi:hypothetical protein